MSLGDFYFLFLSLLFFFTTLNNSALTNFRDPTEQPMPANYSFIDFPSSADSKNQARALFWPPHCRQAHQTFRQFLCHLKGMCEDTFLNTACQCELLKLPIGSIVKDSNTSSMVYTDRSSGRVGPGRLESDRQPDSQILKTWG